eukprot:scaffold114842_cov16-Prasinocladus_malaysianus.AAC.2
MEGPSATGRLSAITSRPTRNRVLARDGNQLRYISSKRPRAKEYFCGSHGLALAILLASRQTRRQPRPNNNLFDQASLPYVGWRSSIALISILYLQRLARSSCWLPDIIVGSKIATLALIGDGVTL